MPYLWPPKGKTVGLPAKVHSRRLNVFGFLSRKGRLHFFQAPERMTADFVIESIEELLRPYCPHLNLIEILWRQTKYRWLAPNVYKDFETLCQSVTEVLAQVGTKY